MKKFIYIILLLGITVQAQQPLIGIIASGGVTDDGFIPASDLYVSQFGDRMTPSGGIRMTGVALNNAGTEAAIISDNEVMLNVYAFDGDAYDISDMSYDSQTNIATLFGGGAAYYDIQIAPDDDGVFFVADLALDEIHQVSLATDGDFSSTFTLDGSWDTPVTNVASFSMNPDGDLITIARTNDATFRTYNVGTTNRLTGTQTINDSHSWITTGSETDFVADYNDGKGMFYSDSDEGGTGVGFSIIIEGKYGDVPYVVDSDFQDDLSRSIDWNGICDRIRCLRYIPADDSFFSGSWGNDHLIKFRDINSDTYLSGQEYDVDLGDDLHAIVVPYQMNELTNTVFSIVLDVNIPSSGASSSDNELVGSTSTNYLRFDHTSGSLFIQIFDGTNSNQNAATFVADGNYHQIVLTYSSTNNQKIYVDGTLVDTGTDIDTPDWTGLNPEQIFQIGSRSGGGSWGDFQIRGFQLYSDELTATEVSDIDIDFTDTASDNLEVYYHDEMGNYFWKDESGNARHAGVESVTRQSQ